jgi:hypothetical protein
MLSKKFKILRMTGGKKMRNEMKSAYGWRIKTLVFIFLISVIGFIHVKSEPKKHSVLKGDTLWDIAGIYYKNPWKWKEIWSVNKDLIRNPDLIYPTQIFSIPGLAQGGVAVSRAESSKDEAAFEEEIMAELEEEIEDEESAEEISALEEELETESETLEKKTTGEMETAVEDAEGAEEVSALEEKLEAELETEILDKEELTAEPKKETTDEMETAVEDAEEISALEEELEAELETEILEMETAVEDAEEISALEEELEAELEIEEDAEKAAKFELEETLEEEIEEEIEEEEIIKPAITVKIDWDADSFVVPRKFSFDGKIIRDKERKILIGQLDIVYLNVGTSQGLKPDSKCYVLRKMGAVKSGYLVKKVGMVKATNAISEHTSTVIVIKSYEPIRVGDLVQVVE